MKLVREELRWQCGDTRGEGGASSRYAPVNSFCAAEAGPFESDPGNSGAGSRAQHIFSLKPGSQRSILRLDDRGQQHGEAVPCDLDANAEQNKRNHAQDAVRSGRRNSLGDLGGIGVAEINQRADHDHCEKYPKVGQNISRDDFVGDVRGEGQQSG